MEREITYAETGVDRELRAKSKTALTDLEQTYKFSKYGKIIHLPYGNIFSIGDRFLDLQIEGIGTKVLLAQLANKFDTIGIDGVAMVVNDCIRSGARPLAIVDNIHAQVSDPDLVKEWMKGVIEGAIESECPIPAGEIGDVGELIKGLIEGKGFDMIVACVGELLEKEIIFGNEIKPGDVIIGFRSSGIHSNGISLARRILFKAWGGIFEPFDIPQTLDREIVYEVLEPTKIYVKPLLRVAKEYKIKGTVHVTGDAYLKFNKLMNFSPGIGFEFNNFKPQPIFQLIQDTAKKLKGVITDEEMFKTFNMGWGFAIVVNKEDSDSILDLLEKENMGSEIIGNVNDSKEIVVNYKNKIVLSR
jgi:phosphoribosylformylglycinamidine cyclo-ligase